MSFMIKKVKSELQLQSKASKKKLEHGVALAAIAASSTEDLLPKMTLERRKISSLKNLKKRTRKSEKAQVEKVSRSLRSYGQIAPILINDQGEIINGHIVAEAMRHLGMQDVLCVIVENLDEHQCAQIHIALNRIAECGDWDIDALKTVVVELDALEIDLGALGFSEPELDLIMIDGEIQSAEAADDIPLPPEDVVSQVGDVWKLGVHRLLCGDATDPESFVRVLQGTLADAVFTDCPWNIPIEGFVSGLGKTKHKDFVSGAGEMTDSEFQTFCNTFHRLGADHLVGGGVFFSCIDWRSVDRITAAGKAAGLRHVNTVVWNKGSGGMGSPYRSAHEFVVVFCKGKKPAVNNIELGKNGRDRTNVWSYPGANRPGSSANKALAHHPTPKPVELVRDALLDVTKRGALVLDPFMGSGTTILAAEKSKRRACGIELDPGYVDVAIRRWEDMTGKTAIHEESGLSFAALAEQRAQITGIIAA